MNHKLLIAKLHDLSLPSSLIALTTDYLSDRSHCVTLRTHGVKSDCKICNTGVPQGTICGPTLWLAFVNNLRFSNQGHSIKYADDTTTYFPLSKSSTDIMSTTADSVEFNPPPLGQKYIDECSSWARDNKMQLNAKKTKVLTVSLKKTLTMSNNYVLNDVHTIDNVTEAKLLVVTLDSHLSFTHHVSNIRKLANKKTHGLLILE